MPRDTNEYRLSQVDQETPEYTEPGQKHAEEDLAADFIKSLRAEEKALDLDISQALESFDPVSART